MKTSKIIKSVVAAALSLAAIGLCLCGMWMAACPVQCLATCLMMDLI